MSTHVDERLHLDTLAALLDDAVAGEPATSTRRLAREVEACRNAYLATLDADASLAVLQIPWQAVIRRARELREAGGHARQTTRCPRCAGTMEDRVVRQTKAGHPPGQHFRRLAGTVYYRTLLCTGCGLTRKP